MKARITIVFATAIVALAVAGGALAAPHQSTVKGSDYASATAGWTSYNPFASVGWTSYDPTAHADPCASRCASAAKPNPWGSRGSIGALLVRPNPSSARGSINGW